MQQVQCPYCGETIELTVDTSAGEQAYIEDCSVCCRPIEVQLVAGGDEWMLLTRRDDD
ncbi:MAG: CPXCG motif-containing cysteine-rich protein [Chromatiaceae bacterium]|nr:CPXCG motif-containing cysteine-rich protein [Gammaproteobacteria bacterium]MCP5300715.1 CPXCG motif-containing cysteine-rich protein [Chromatiaceae bacterium]MCP5422787.1 CPXCG motif-containing cysteine-rich protein [Chromatiaceae bacterium]